MGQDLANPPTVEGCNGPGVIDSGTLVESINFTADQMGKHQFPGIRAIIRRLAAEGPTLSAERLVMAVSIWWGIMRSPRHPQHAGRACAKGRRTAPAQRTSPSGWGRRSSSSHRPRNISLPKRRRPWLRVKQDNVLVVLHCPGQRRAHTVIPYADPLYLENRPVVRIDPEKVLPSMIRSASTLP